MSNGLAAGPAFADEIPAAIKVAGALQHRAPRVGILLAARLQGRHVPVVRRRRRISLDPQGPRPRRTPRHHVLWRLEARIGTPKLLELLRQVEMKATFFITGWSADAHPAMCGAILKDGHEIGHHGYHHLLPDPGSPEIQEELEMGFDALKRILGVVPTGCRALIALANRANIDIVMIDGQTLIQAGLSTRHNEAAITAAGAAAVQRIWDLPEAQAAFCN